MRRSAAASGTVSAIGRLSIDWVAMPERAVGERGSRPCRPAMGTASSALESGTARGRAVAEFMVMIGMVHLHRRAKCLVSDRVSRLVSQLFRVSDVTGTVWCLVSSHRSCLVSGPGSWQLSGVWSWVIAALSDGPRKNVNGKVANRKAWRPSTSMMPVAMTGPSRLPLRAGFARP